MADPGGGRHHSEAAERLLAPTLADALKEATGGKGKVVTLSFKDRSAALPGGRQPDACYWIDTTSGLAVTSTYYRDTLHPWVEQFNRDRPADRWFGKEWTRLRPDLDSHELLPLVLRTRIGPGDARELHARSRADGGLAEDLELVVGEFGIGDGEEVFPVVGDADDQATGAVAVVGEGAEVFGEFRPRRPAPATLVS